MGEDRAGQSVSSDPRFARVLSDPRFRRDPNRRRRLARDGNTDVVEGNEDERFKVREGDKRFGGGKGPQVDKYGRIRVTGKVVEAPSSSSEEQASPSEKEAGSAIKAVAAVNLSSSDEDWDELDDEGWEEEEENIEIGEESRRLALFGVDWDHLSAVDVLSTFRSFCPNGGKVEKVVVYPSNFGMEQMKKDSLAGPSFLSERNEALSLQKEAEGDDGEENSSDDPEEGKDVVERENEEEDGKADESDEEEEEDEPDVLESYKIDAKLKAVQDLDAMRKYEKQRLKYYYAILDCDSVRTASSLYEQCDGVEFEDSGNCFDLRFVPDGVTFDNPPRDEAKEVPPSYEPPSFRTKVLQSTNVELTWDNDKADRVVLRKKYLKKDEIIEQDLQAYLASDSSEEEEKDEVARKRALLLGNDDVEASGEEKDKKDDTAETENGAVEDEYDAEEIGDVEIQFEPGLENAGADILEAKAEKLERANETQWEARMRRLKERRKERRKAIKAAKRGGPPVTTKEKEEEVEEGFFEEEDGSADEEEAKAAKKREEQQLELLTMDAQPDVDSDEEGQRRIGKRGKSKNKSRKKGDKASFKADLDDARFGALYTSHEFALDPTHPKYVKNSGTGAILKAREERRQAALKKAEISTQKTVDQDAHTVQDPAKEGKSKHKDIAELAERVKRKAAKGNESVKRRRVLI